LSIFLSGRLSIGPAIFIAIAGLPVESNFWMISGFSSAHRCFSAAIV
jgi:hypothetical protein